MNKIFHNIRNFHLPSWRELPDEKLYSEELCRLVNKILSPLDDESLSLTANMLQNYLKWGLLPPIKGRKYDKEQLSWCICITLYKKIMPIKDVAKGIILQKKLLDTAEAYDEFARAINQGITAILKGFAEGDQQFSLPAVNLEAKTMALTISADLFVRYFILDCILKNNGLYSRKESEEEMENE